MAKILIAEDVEKIALLERDYLESNGYETVAITDYSILTDTETGVQYLMFKNDVGKYATGYMSVLMNPDGTPIVTVE